MYVKVVAKNQLVLEIAVHVKFHASKYHVLLESMCTFVNRIVSESFIKIAVNLNPKRRNW